MTRYSEGSEAPTVIVMTLFLVVTLISGSLACFGTKWWKFGHLFHDDYYLILALVGHGTKIDTVLVSHDCLGIVTISTPKFIPFLRQLQLSGMRLDGMRLDGMTRYTVSSHAQSSRTKYFLLSRDRRRTDNESAHELD
ncbi:uncharacterized protein ACLA_004590 [Aspergillus clavatus NRRL 1]|uniref:Uncharacterized protein n=1 Tax=Aspergillus clavatus (strain ATCC 1007 / CBS 513.65 / DSM 816 / NCTC 3887 / NRRL 1 / QM 1276 / 107) TaxID=344612 RepID=A1C5S7_ASPCL|nr:uncharacterized protein ACLA_004590 [Aspergillus clavatus NRRL 1]EAW15045.1 hypothetical protein ACLA_004590 [Aspergillus clavatus NRRL 1]